VHHIHSNSKPRTRQPGRFLRLPAVLVVIRPPLRYEYGRSSVLPVMFFYLATISPTSLGRFCETDRKLGEFYNAGPKIRGTPPPQKNGAKNMQNFGRFYTISAFHRDSGTAQDIQKRKANVDQFLLRSKKKVWGTLVH